MKRISIIILAAFIMSIGSASGQRTDDEQAEKRRGSRHRFTPHWSGFELGMNNFMSSDYSLSLPSELNYLDINTGKSFNVNLNIYQLGIGLTKHFGLVTGLGFELNNYKFDGNNNITKDDNGVIIPFYPEPGIDLEKSKLATSYFTVPLLIEAQLPLKYRNTLNIAAGVIGGIKIGSHTKMVYHDNGGKQKIKEKDDFSLSVLRYGPTVRIGYEAFQIYATYYMTSMFIENKGPELYPVQIGISFSSDR